MKSPITYENLSLFTYTNDQLIPKEKIRGIVVFFNGLGATKMRPEDSPEGFLYASHGLIYLVPYGNPWAWMNRQQVAYTDELIDVLLKHYGLDADFPVCSIGNSMGGLSCIVYTAYTKHHVISCAANCPVCDLPYHYTERPDLPRTLYSAFYYEDGEIEEVLKTASPLHLIPRLPAIPYTIYHCELDKSVNKQMHSDVFVSELQKTHTVTYVSVPESGHCALPPEYQASFNDCVINSFS